MSQDEAVLQQALRLYQESRYQESEAAFEQIRTSPVVGYRALAGLGMIRIAQNRMRDAAALFESSLNQKFNADAFYGLGHISEVAGETARATSLYARALQQDPSHTAANRRLDAIAHQPKSVPVETFSPPQAAERPPQRDGSWRPQVTVPVAENRPPVADNPRQPDTVSYAYSGSGVPVFYTILAGDNSELSQRTLQLLSQLSIENRRPRYSAYPGRILAFPLLLGIAFVYLYLMSRSHGSIGPIALLFLGFILLCLFIVFLKIVNMARTRYTIKDGWIRVELGHGFLQKTDETEEITHLIDTSLKQGLLETITNNAVLVLNFGPHIARMRLRGLAPRRELKKIREELNDLYRMLRSNPLLKGLVA
jgi:tetratricopeptide (TPR) repeat protein